MGLYQRAGTWWVDFYTGGKRVQESTGTKNKREAQRLHALRISEVERGVYARPVKISFHDFGERYMDHAKTHKRSWDRDEQMLKRLEEFFGPVMLNAITLQRVEEYQQARVREVSPSTVNRETALLKHMFNLADRWELTTGRNPVRYCKFLFEDNLQFQTLSEADEKALLAHCLPYLQDLIQFAINTGLRCGDIFRLTWEEVDFDEKRINIVMQKSRKRLSVPLNERACEILAAWHGMKRGPHVFYNQLTGDRFRDPRAGLKLACEQAGLKHVTWHTLRHTFASRLIRSGTDIVTVKELLGHSTILVTMRYAHTNEEAKIKAVQSLSSDKVVTVTPKPRRLRSDRVGK
jgi:integrase